MTIEQGLLTLTTTLSGVVVYLYKRLEANHFKLEERLNICENERMALLKHILTTDTHREFKERVAETFPDLIGGRKE